MSDVEALAAFRLCRSSSSQVRRCLPETRKPLHANRPELLRPQMSVAPRIREGEAASESLATAIDGGYQVEQLESWRWDGNPGQ